MGSFVIDQQSLSLNFSQGPYIKDVRTRRGGGGSPKADIVREVAWIYSYIGVGIQSEPESDQKADKGGRGSKIPKILRTSFMYGPLEKVLAHESKINYDST